MRPSKAAICVSEDDMALKTKARDILKLAFDEMARLQIIVVNSDAWFGERVDSCSVSCITKEEWLNGVWKVF